MGHYMLAVVHHKTQSIDDLMTEFSEDIDYIPDENLEFIDMTETVKTSYKTNHRGYKTLSSYAEEMYGFETRPDGKFGYYANAKAKWDYFEPYSRCDKIIPLIDGTMTNEASVKTINKNDASWYPYAVLTPNGEWYELNDYAGDKEWIMRFSGIMDSMDPDCIVSMVDYHI